MATVSFQEGIKVIPTSVKRFPIVIEKKGVNKLGVKVIFKSPRKESISTIEKRLAINNTKGGNIRGINKELTWNKNETGGKTIYVDILKKEIGEPLSFDIELELLSTGSVETRFCRCILIENLLSFLDKNIYSKENIETIDLFSRTESKRFQPVFLDENLIEIENFVPDVEVKENKIETSYINETIFHIDGFLNAKIFYPSEEIFDELEIEKCYLGLKIPFENLYEKKKIINIYSENGIKGFLKEKSQIIVLTNNAGEKLVHRKDDEKEASINISIESLVKVKI